jgi:hypothetical protein
MYPVAGSFVRHLIDQHGLTPLRSYFASARFDHSAAQTRAAFHAAYGISVDEAWAAWRAWLASAPTAARLQGASAHLQP